MGESDATLRFDAYTLHCTQGLSREGTEVRVTQKALRVLWLLACRSGETVTKEELFRDAWPGVAVSDAALTSCIRELRSALEDDANRPRFIETRHRQGFRFLPPARPVAASHLPNVHLSQARDTGACVGRQGELAVLAAALGSAAAGARQLAVVRGEAGIGKTTLLRAFVDGLAADETTVVTGTTCTEAIGGCEPYRPLLDSVSTLCRVSGLDRDARLLRQYAPSWWAQFPAFQALVTPSLSHASPGTVTTTRMSRELTDYLESLSTLRTIVLWIDDVQWADDVTLDWLVSFMARVEAARVLLVAALREEYDTRGHQVLARLQTRPSCHAVRLAGLDQAAVLDIVRHRHIDDPEIAPLASRLHAQTEGHPLFVTVLVDELIAAPRALAPPMTVRGADDHHAASRPLPERLRSLIDAQIAHLDPTEIELLEIASQSTSLDWPSALVAAGAHRQVLEVEEALLRLARRRAFIEHAGPTRWPDGTVSEAFAFRHALHRDALRERISAHRRAIIHSQIGVRLEQAFGTRAHELAHQLSRHFEEAGHGDKAVAYLLEAADAANRVGAASDVARYLTRALALLRTEASSAERDDREATLQVRLGGALMAARGWGAPEVERAYVRARELCELHEGSPHRFAVYWGLWLFRWGRGELFEARALVERLWQVAHGSTDRLLRLQVHHAQWATAFCLGALDDALAHADEGWALSRSDIDDEATLAYGNHHAGVCARGFAARALALRGQGDAARTAADDAVARARDFSHPFTLALALVFAGATHQTLRDAEAARRFAEGAEAVSLDHGFGLLLAWARALKGWTLRMANADAAVRLVRESVASAVSTGSRQFETWLLGLLAETLLAAGLVDEGMAEVNKALAHASAVGERFNEPELRRIQRELVATRARRGGHDRTGGTDAVD